MVGVECQLWAISGWFQWCRIWDFKHCSSHCSYHSRFFLLAVASVWLVCIWCSSAALLGVQILSIPGLGWLVARAWEKNVTRTEIAAGVMLYWTISVVFFEDNHLLQPCHWFFTSSLSMKIALRIVAYYQEWSFLHQIQICENPFFWLSYLQGQWFLP